MCDTVKNIQNLLERIRVNYENYLSVIDLRDIIGAIDVLNCNKNIVDIQSYTEQCFSHGRKEVWDLIKEILKTDYSERTEFLGARNKYFEDMLNNLTPEDVIKKFNKWKEKNKNEFEQGDKIYCRGNNSYGVITYKFDSCNEFHVMWNDGSVDAFTLKDVEIDGIENTGEKVDLSELFNILKGGDKNSNKE